MVVFLPLVMIVLFLPMMMWLVAGLVQDLRRFFAPGHRLN